jgi:hypothetical protein
MKSKIVAVLAIWLIVSSGYSSLAHGGQVTKNSYEDAFPQIKGDCLVWQGHVDSDWEILFYNMATQKKHWITYNDYDDISPQTDGTYVVWLGFSHPGGEIFLYDMVSGKTTQITSDNHIDSPPQIADGRVVWASREVTASVEPGEIFLYHIATGLAERLTEDAQDDSSPRIDDERVMWVRDDGQGTKVVVHDLETGKTILEPQGFVWEDTPQTDGGVTVLTQHDGTDGDIFVYNANINTYQKLTDNDSEDRSPRISGNNIAWVGGEGQASEIYLNSEVDPAEPDWPDTAKTGSTTSDGRSGNSGGCFIVSAAFGSYEDLHVHVIKNLREFFSAIFLPVTNPSPIR